MLSRMVVTIPINAKEVGFYHSWGKEWGAWGARAGGRGQSEPEVPASLRCWQAHPGERWLQPRPSNCGEAVGRLNCYDGELHRCSELREREACGLRWGSNW